MAIINHSGKITSDETWASTDEHHIVGNITVEGVAPPGPKVTVESGVIINWDGYYQIYGEGLAGAQNYAEFYAAASDWSNKIFSRPDPTTFPEPSEDEYSGLNSANGLALILRFVHVQCCARWAFAPAYSANGGERGDIDIQKCLVEYSVYPLIFRNKANDADGSDFTYKNNIHRFCNKGFFDEDQPGSNPGTVWSGAFDVDRCFSYSMYAQNVGHTDNAINCFYDWPFAFTDWVFSHGIAALGCRDRHSTFKSGFSGPIIWTNCYFGYLHQISDTEPAVGTKYWGAINWESEDHEQIVMTECVVVESEHLIRTFGYTTDDPDWYGHDCDFFDNNARPLRGKTGSGRGNVDNCHFMGNDAMPGVQIEHTQNEEQYGDAEGGTHTVSLTPNKPLEIDNIAEGAPGVDSITITFDSKAGPQGRRCDGVGFIKYGIVSGVYTECTLFPMNVGERAFAWTQIQTTFGQFKQTGHSVTINNLKAGTTYYYKCCFADPLGRIGESVEGSFVTSVSGYQGFSRNIIRRV